MHINQLCAILGQGAQNIVYSVRNDPDIVVKIAKSYSLNLEKQRDILSALDSTALFPIVFSSGKMQLGTHLFNNLPVQKSFIVMEKLGISLQEFLDLRQGNINLSTIRKIGLQLLQKIKILHQFNILHNDIKPANILFGLKQKRNQIFIIDFGMADRLQEIQSQDNDSQLVNYVFKGNIKFSSLRKLKGYKSTKIDDLQSLLYLLIWILGGGKYISQLSGFQRNTDSCKQNLRQFLQFQFQSKKFFIENFQILLSERLSGQRLDLCLMICSLLKLIQSQYNQQSLDYFYQSISKILLSHK